jgi:outer membrane protein TolC
MSLSKWLYDFSNKDDLKKIFSNYEGLNLSKELPNVTLINKKLLNSNDENNTLALINLLEQHPSIRNIDQNIKASAKDISIEKQKYKSQFGINTSFSYRDDDKFGNVRANLFSIGVSMDIPMYTDSLDSSVKAARLYVNTIKTKKWLQLRNLLTTFQTSKVSLNRLEQRYKLYTNKLLPQIKEENEATLTSSTNDDGSFSDVVRSSISLLNTKVDILNIKIDIQKNKIALNYVLMNNYKEILK